MDMQQYLKMYGKQRNTAFFLLMSKLLIPKLIIIRGDPRGRALPFLCPAAIGLYSEPFSRPRSDQGSGGTRPLKYYGFSNRYHSSEFMSSESFRTSVPSKVHG